MSAPFASALRARFQKYIAEGLSGWAAASRLKRSAIGHLRNVLIAIIRKLLILANTLVKEGREWEEIRA